MNLHGTVVPSSQHVVGLEGLARCLGVVRPRPFKVAACGTGTTVPTQHIMNSQYGGEISGPYDGRNKPQIFNDLAKYILQAG